MGREPPVGLSDRLSKLRLRAHRVSGGERRGGRVLKASGLLRGYPRSQGLRARVPYSSFDTQLGLPADVIGSAAADDHHIPKQDLRGFRV